MLTRMFVSKRCEFRGSRLFQMNITDGSGLDWTNEADRLLVSEMAIKLSDINGPCKRRDIHVQWTHRIEQEFYEQGESRSEFSKTKTSVGTCNLIRTKKKGLFEAFVVLLQAMRSNDSVSQCRRSWIDLDLSLPNFKNLSSSISSHPYVTRTAKPDSFPESGFSWMVILQHSTINPAVSEHRTRRTFMSVGWVRGNFLTRPRPRSEVSVRCASVFREYPPVKTLRWPHLALEDPCPLSEGWFLFVNSELAVTPFAIRAILRWSLTPETSNADDDASSSDTNLDDDETRDCGKPNPRRASQVFCVQTQHLQVSETHFYPRRKHSRDLFHSTRSPPSFPRPLVVHRTHSHFRALQDNYAYWIKVIEKEQETTSSLKEGEEGDGDEP